MELKEIQTLIKFVASQGVDEVSIERKDFKLSIKKNETTTQVVQAAIPVAAPTAPIAPAAIAAPTTPATTPVAEVPASDTAASNLIEIKSPMIGTFYRAANPESPDFVSVGDEVKVGKVVCIIEAMKLFNEIESEVSGKIVKVLVDNATPVEYGQALFLVEPA